MPTTYAPASSKKKKKKRRKSEEERKGKEEKENSLRREERKKEKKIFLFSPTLLTHFQLLLLCLPSLYHATACLLPANNGSVALAGSTAVGTWTVTFKPYTTSCTTIHALLPSRAQHNPGGDRQFERQT